jgi:hypothetical protein
VRWRLRIVVETAFSVTSFSLLVGENVVLIFFGLRLTDATAVGTARRREDFNQGSEQNWERLSRNQVGEALELTLVLASREPLPLHGDLNVNIALHIRTRGTTERPLRRALARVPTPCSWLVRQGSATVDLLHTNKDNVAEHHAALIHAARIEITGD